MCPFATLEPCKTFGPSWIEFPMKVGNLLMLVAEGLFVPHNIGLLVSHLGSADGFGWQGAGLSQSSPLRMLSMAAAFGTICGLQVTVAEHVVGPLSVMARGSHFEA